MLGRCSGKDPPGKMPSEQELEENLLFLKLSFFASCGGMWATVRIFYSF